MPEQQVQTIFDIYRDWPFLGIILILSLGLYFLFKSYQKQGEDRVAAEKEARQEYLENNKALWDRHKAERDELRAEISSRDLRVESIMEKLIKTLEGDRKNNA